MKKGLPKFLMLTDPYSSLEGRILILKTEFPRYIFELNRPEDPDSQTIHLHGIDYSILIRKNLDQNEELSPGILKEAVRWFHYSLNVQNGPKTDI